MRRTNRLAVVSLVAGMLWAGGIGSFFGLLGGFVALMEIRADVRQRGLPVAVAAMVAAVVGLVAAYVAFVELNG